MKLIFEALLILFSRRRRLNYVVKEFASRHKNLLVIVADRKTDVVFTAYKDVISHAKLMGLHGRNLNIINEVLKSSGKFDGAFKQFVVGIGTHLKISKKLFAKFGEALLNPLWNVRKAVNEKQL